jgi:hypothetical protein
MESAFCMGGVLISLDDDSTYTVREKDFWVSFGSGMDRGYRIDGVFHAWVGVFDFWDGCG